MKKVISLLAIILLSTFIKAAIPIASIERHGKGRFGYNYVHFELVTLNSGGQAYVGQCKDPGRERCVVGHPNIGSNDPNDLYATDYLIDIADKAIDSEDFSGTETYQVQVSGENFIRVYTVIWSTDNRGDGTIDITRENINL